MNPRYAPVAKRAGHRCEYCHAPESIFNFPFEVEHIIPSCRRGSDDDENLALACRACNLFKAEAVNCLDPATNATVPLFHPRLDLWDEHFQFNRETGAIDGRTRVGRATVVRLQMNSELQLAARQQWAQLGLFP